MRTDLQPVRDADQISVDLRMLTARRTDLVCDRVRAINRLRATLLEYFPALERAFDYSKNKAALTLLSEYQTPDRLRRLGATRLAAWLLKHGCRNSAAVAAAAVDAAHQQFTTLPAEPIGSTLVIRLAAEISAIDRDLVELDAQLTDRFRQHEAAESCCARPDSVPCWLRRSSPTSAET